MSTVATQGSASAPTISRWLALAASVGVLGLAFIIMRPGPAPLSFDVAIEQGQTVYRANAAAAPGDVLQVNWRGALGDGEAMAIFVYRDGRDLVGYCGADAVACFQPTASSVFSVTMDIPGIYQPVIAVSQKALGAPTGQLDEDVLVLRESGASRVELLSRVTVR